MSITFYSAKNLTEAFSANIFLNFHNHIRYQLIDLYDKQTGKELKSLELLVMLDPYGDKEFTDQELNNLIHLLTPLSKTVHDNSTKEFLISLKDFCEEVQKTGNKLIALGD